MRLRNIPRADEIIAESSYVIQDAKTVRGAWKQAFGNDHPIHIEVGMGKGRFITQMAFDHPEINYVGIERYSSVLLRALEKRETMTELQNLFFLCIEDRKSVV